MASFLNHNSAKVPELQPRLEYRALSQRLGLFTLGIVFGGGGGGGVVDLDFAGDANLNPKP